MKGQKLTCHTAAGRKGSVLRWIGFTAFFAFFGVALCLCEPQADLQIPRVHRAPKLQEFIDGTPREAEVAVTAFRQLDPVNGAPISKPTTAFLSFDEKNLYVGWICKDELEKIRARVARREDVMNDDRITINIDTFNDHTHSYWFDVNPYGVQSDGITTDGQGDDVSWDSLWYSEGKFTSDGYVVLETIPFRSLRFRAGNSQRWGFTLCRFIMRNNETSCSPHISRERMPQWVGQFGTMEIPENISPGRNLQFIPYEMFSAGRYLDSETGPRSFTENRLGMDTKMVLRDAFTLDMAINPDFSQVESDQPQVTVNQRYEVVYPEQRPFFTENAGLFRLPEQLFFSRRIVDPQFGARLSGRAGRWSLGFLVADDRSTGEKLASDDANHGDRSLDEVLRLQFDFDRQSHIGFTAINTDFASTHNRVGSLDVRKELGGNWFAKALLAYSTTRQTGGVHTNGQDLLAGISNSTLHTSLSSTYTDRSPGFASVLGYIPRVDIREWKNTADYRWRMRNSGVMDFGPSLTQAVDWDRQGRLQEWWVKPSFTLDMLRLTTFTVAYNWAFELFEDIAFPKHSVSFQATSEPSKRLAFYSDMEIGRGVNYYPAVGILPFPARIANADAGLTWRPVPRMKIDESYIYSHLGANRRWLPETATSGSAIFNNHILRTKMNYQFTRFLGLRTILDYRSVLPNTQLVSLDRSKSVGADVLLTYLLHPGTAIYAGYSDSYENVHFDSLQSPPLQRTQFPDTNTGRQVFVKISYLFRY
jgi:hypothetical protein